jgi:hypothetical protein
MDIVEIKRGDQLIEAVKPDDNSIQYKKIMGDNELRLQFSLNYYANFLIGDYADVFGERYKLNVLPVVEKVSTFRYQYTMTMQARYSDLQKVQYFFLGEDNTLKQPDFSLMGNPDTFLDLMLANLARAGQVDWVKGQTVPADYKNISFSGVSCYEALGQMATAFNTEYWIEGNTIHLTKRQYNTGQIFQHGKGKGLYDIVRQLADGVKLLTRIYPFGSDKNLPSDYRNGSNRLLLPSPDVYIEKNADKYGVIEATQIFDDIYPHRTGTVTAVNAADPFRFKDTAIDFDVNAQLLQGTPAKVTFNTGQLSGYTFDIASFDNATKEFKILLNKNETAYTDGIPNATVRPSIGDQYVLVDIRMPNSYITAAEQELKAQALAVLDTYSEPVYNYKVTFDPVYLRSMRIVPAIGQVVTLIDTELQVNKPIRIVTASRNIVNEYSVEVDLSDVVTTSIITNLTNAVNTTSSGLTDLSQSVNSNSLIRDATAIGDLKVRQGTIVAPDMTTAPPGAVLRQLYIDLSTGKIYHQ